MNIITASRREHPIPEDLAIQLGDVSVVYRLPREHVSGIKEFAIRWLQRRLSYEDFWALKSVSLQVRRGEVFGIIGANGSGKSTLLKVIARVLYPTEGRVIVRGRVAPLLELGAGFHPELTGRENVYLNSALLGRTKEEVDRLLPEIIRFAEIEEFIDAPLRTFSTGMIARLGFSVATCVRPEILLVDEVLSVGDAAFQQKCLDRMYSFQEQGTTIVIVSHSMATIQTFCDRAMWLNRGQIVVSGSVDEVIKRYMRKGTTQAHAPVGKSPRKPASRDKPKTFNSLPDSGQIYPAEDLLDVEQGAVTAWVKLDSQRQFKDAVIFHSDDSRYIIYMGSYFSSEMQQDVLTLNARAGGNRRAIDPYYGSASYPELSATLSTTRNRMGTLFSQDEWHFVAMTWEGYPQGRLILYIDGQFIGERSYDGRHDNGQPLPKSVAVGMRPQHWVGEILERKDGTKVELRPETTLSIDDSNIEVRDVRLYQAFLTEAEIWEIRDKTSQKVSPAS
jgi:ABC-type polysaccharide/polyol phosphate transport system ATPase subunit